jgi:hypothetical protein
MDSHQPIRLAVFRPYDIRRTYMEFPRPPHYLATYLPVVTADYFGRLQYTHAATVRDMPRHLREDVQPWFSNPDAGLGAPLFTTAMNGALANFLGDAARGHVTSKETRAETAIKGALTMGLLSIMRDTTTRNRSGRSVNEVIDFHRQVRTALDTGERRAPSANLWSEGQVAAIGLARYMSVRLGFDGYGKQKFSLQFGAYTRAAERQFAVRADNVSELTEVADGIGRTTAALVLQLTEATDEREYDEGRLIADSIGRQGSFRDHGTMILSALRAGTPTYATAMLRRDIRPDADLDAVADALKVVYLEREELVTRAHVGVDSNADLSRFQHDIHDMAGILTRRMYGVRRRREIKAAGGNAAYLQQVKDHVLAEAA